MSGTHTAHPVEIVCATAEKTRRAGREFSQSLRGGGILISGEPPGEPDVAAIKRGDKFPETLPPHARRLVFCTGGNSRRIRELA